MICQWFKDDFRGRHIVEGKRKKNVEGCFHPINLQKTISQKKKKILLRVVFYPKDYFTEKLILLRFVFIQKTISQKNKYC